MMKQRHLIDLLHVENDTSCSEFVQKIEEPDTSDLPAVFPRNFATIGVYTNVFTDRVTAETSESVNQE